MSKNKLTDMGLKTVGKVTVIGGGSSKTHGNIVQKDQINNEFSSSNLLKDKDSFISTKCDHSILNEDFSVVDGKKRDVVNEGLSKHGELEKNDLSKVLPEDFVKIDTKASWKFNQSVGGGEQDADNLNNNYEDVSKFEDASLQNQYDSNSNLNYDQQDIYKSPPSLELPVPLKTTKSRVRSDFENSKKKVGTVSKLVDNQKYSESSNDNCKNKKLDKINLDSVDRLVNRSIDNISDYSNFLNAGNANDNRYLPERHQKESVGKSDNNLNISQNSFQEAVSPVLSTDDNNHNLENVNSQKIEASNIATDLDSKNGLNYSAIDSLPSSIEGSSLKTSVSDTNYNDNLESANKVNARKYFESIALSSSSMYGENSLNNQSNLKDLPKEKIRETFFKTEFGKSNEISTDSKYPNSSDCDIKESNPLLINSPSLSKLKSRVHMFERKGAPIFDIQELEKEVGNNLYNEPKKEEESENNSILNYSDLSDSADPRAYEVIGKGQANDVLSHKNNALSRLKERFSHVKTGLASSFKFNRKTGEIDLGSSRGQSEKQLQSEKNDLDKSGGKIPRTKYSKIIVFKAILYILLLILLGAGIYIAATKNIKSTEASFENANQTEKNIYNSWIIGYFGEEKDANADEDKDSLTNWEEFLIGSNPSKFSNCENGLSDGRNLSNGIDPSNCKSFDIKSNEATKKFKQIIDFKKLESSLIKEERDIKFKEQTVSELFNVRDIRDINYDSDEILNTSQEQLLEKKKKYLYEMRKIAQYMNDHRSYGPHDRSVGLPIHPAFFVDASIVYNTPLDILVYNADYQTKFGTDLYNDEGVPFAFAAAKNMYKMTSENGDLKTYDNWEGGVYDFAKWYKESVKNQSSLCKIITGNAPESEKCNEYNQNILDLNRFLED